MISKEQKVYLKGLEFPMISKEQKVYLKGLEFLMINKEQKVYLKGLEFPMISKEQKVYLKGLEFPLIKKEQKVYLKGLEFPLIKKEQRVYLKGPEFHRNTKEQKVYLKGLDFPLKKILKVHMDGQYFPKIISERDHVISMTLKIITKQEVYISYFFKDHLSVKLLLFFHIRNKLIAVALQKELIKQRRKRKRQEEAMSRLHNSEIEDFVSLGGNK
jgi:hypothetical protein